MVMANNEPRNCEQDCGRLATVYGIDPLPGGWGGYYCDACVKALGFRVVDRLRTRTELRTFEDGSVSIEAADPNDRRQT